LELDLAAWIALKALKNRWVYQLCLRFNGKYTWAQLKDSVQIKLAKRMGDLSPRGLGWVHAILMPIQTLVEKNTPLEL
jgi:hypothetical protein